MKKKLFSLLLALAMCLSLSIPAWAVNQIPSSLPSISSNSANYVPSEKIGEDSEYVYFSTELPITSVSFNAAGNDTASIVPAAVSASVTSAVNKTQGKIIVYITVVSSQSIRTATCFYITIRGDMGLESHSDITATNLIAVPSIIISDTFTDLEKNVETGTVYIVVGPGTFSGPNITGTFSGLTTSIDLADMP